MVQPSCTAVEHSLPLRLQPRFRSESVDGALGPFVHQAHPGPASSYLRAAPASLTLRLTGWEGGGSLLFYTCRRVD